MGSPDHGANNGAETGMRELIAAESKTVRFLLKSGRYIYGLPHAVRPPA